jgi:ankyrin repeat protein
MFSLFNSSAKKESSYTANQIVDMLETDQENQSQFLNYFGKDYKTRHHNTNLLQAIAWNKKNAAIKLINLDKEKTSLNLKDDWPTCNNSPIILAAKVNDTDILEQLISVGVNVNEQDYRGFTALHYACLYRNEHAIKQLLNANADLQLTDAFGNKPYDYYCMDISENDLQYRYGYRDGFLNHVPDMDNHYFSTKKKCLSALRWYIAHIIVNNNLGKSDNTGSISLHTYAKQRLQIREPVYDVNFYKAMMKCFLDNRPKIDMQLSSQLISNSSNGYVNDELEKYHLDPLDLVPRTAIHQEGSETWIELQQLQKPGN